VRDYLALAPTDVTDWQFIEVRDVPPGPWRSYGENNTSSLRVVTTSNEWQIAASTRKEVNSKAPV